LAIRTDSGKNDIFVFNLKVLKFVNVQAVDGDREVKDPAACMTFEVTVMFEDDIVMRLNSFDTQAVH
jgi:hypothetical protein